MSSSESSETMFDTAVFVVQNLPRDGPVKTSNDEKLHFYALFKQATHGKCDVAKPSFYDVQGVYKWSAWNRLDDMSPEEAQNKYVEAIQEKIRHMQKTYKTEEWMKGDSYQKLAPKLRILGVLEEEVLLMNEHEEDVGHSSTFALSDAEYADALDDEEHSRSSSFTEARIIRRQNSPSSLKSTCHRLEKELKVITESIDKLGKAVEERHNLLINLMKKATVYILVPRATSWRTVIFFVFWPFVAHFLLRWFRRFLALI